MEFQVNGTTYEVLQDWYVIQEEQYLKLISGYMNNGNSRYPPKAIRHIAGLLVVSKSESFNTRHLHKIKEILKFVNVDVIERIMDFFLANARKLQTVTVIYSAHKKKAMEQIILIFSKHSSRIFFIYQMGIFQNVNRFLKCAIPISWTG